MKENLNLYRVIGNIYGKVVADKRKSILLELEVLNVGLTRLTLKHWHFVGVTQDL